MDNIACTMRRFTMDSYQNYEQEIDLKDLMFAVLRRWRSIILVGIIFALLLGGFKAFRGLGQMKDAEYVASKQQEYDNSMDQYEMSKERLEKEIENIKVSLESQNDYMENSVLMNINPYDEYTTSASFYVATDYQIMPGMAYQNPNTASSIMAAYMSMIQNGELYNTVLKRMDPGLDLRYLQELVTVEPDYDNNMFHVRVISNTEEGAEEIMSLLMESLSEYQAAITQKIGPHLLNVIQDTQVPGPSAAPGSGETNKTPEVYTTVDLELEKKQQDQSARTQTLNQSLTDKTKELNELKEPANTLPSTGSTLKSSVKYGVLGGVLGVFLAVFFICVAFLMSDKLVNERELRRRYGLMVLGVFDSGEKKRLFASADRFLDRLEGTSARKMSSAQVCSVVAANVMNYVGEAKQILLVTSTGTEALDTVNGVLSAALPSLTLISGGNLDREADAIRKAASCDAVILVEKRKASSFTGIERELEIVKSLDKKILGCIVL